MSIGKKIRELREKKRCFNLNFGKGNRCKSKGYRVLGEGKEGA